MDLIDQWVVERESAALAAPPYSQGGKSKQGKKDTESGYSAIKVAEQRKRSNRGSDGRQRCLVLVVMAGGGLDGVIQLWWWVSEMLVVVVNKGDCFDGGGGSDGW
ncbi:hypothetical protein HAX54_017705 [Datura stramonium]|uniref:Uncharacterized protein n=1 Tax=Datura stramonium TaxID=4076 RepID=A0ABS8S303_DATST|nr:hypothetical protein [Datura stramonium]